MKWDGLVPRVCFGRYLGAGRWFTPRGRRGPGGLHPTGRLDGQVGTLQVSALTPPLGKLAQFSTTSRR